MSQLAFRKHQGDNAPLTQAIERFDVLICGVVLGLIAPQARHHLSADALFGLLRNGVSTVPDHRRDGSKMTMADALMSGGAMVARPCPSLLDDDQQRADANVQTLYGMQGPPCDSSRREGLDPRAPESLRPACKAALRPLQRGTALAAMVFCTGCSVLALDGTGECASTKMHGPSCLAQHPRDGSTPSAHPRWGAALRHPDRRAVLPLMPAPLVKPDGTENNAGARHAAQRLRAQVRPEHPPLQWMVTADGLSAKAPHLDTRHAEACHALLGVKEGDPASLFAQGHVAEHEGRVTHEERRDRGAGSVPPLRFLHEMPLTAARSAVRVHGIADWDVSQDNVQPGRWVTDCRVTTQPVDTRMRGGRARWKSAHETCKTLTNPGDNFDHHDGHGEQHRSVVLAMLMRLALLVDQTQQRCGALCQAVWARLGRTRLLGERLRALCFDDALESMRQWLAALCDGLKQSAPLLADESSSALHDPRDVSVGDLDDGQS